ncbi:trimeric autotransporter adhesin [Stenotrophomonas rhizophila]|uniref:Trimeric autotransporter adhesin n=1 Tax=Stenotrophomonas rhizophila TaxID=216778 RepID=A0A498CGB0_9GAMM|nr:ESPR-type extended signal peptide-containing protein [Stenotrophomonas rhizophila]RLK56023.1 trimeric autotransporter adhesin [Stenotrophomonas rhizophila]
MNHIYRLIWNTALGCWMVASEHTKGRGKRASGARAVATAAVALVLSLPVMAANDVAADDAEEQLRFTVVPEAVMSPFAAQGVAPRAVAGILNVHNQTALTSDSSYKNATLSGDHSIVLGSRSAVSGGYSTAYGNQVVVNGPDGSAFGFGANADGIGATALGAKARASHFALAVGYSASATGTADVAIGNKAVASGTYSNAMGYSATATGANSVAIGTLAKGAASSAVSLGNRAEVAAAATNSVALGSTSSATAANTVSVGNATLKRKIVNVADGALTASSTEAVTGKQLNATNQTISTNAAKVQSLITEASSTGTVRVGIGNDGVRLDVRNKDNQNRTLTGVSDGALSATSTEAVTGKQLHATDGKVTGVDNKAVAAQTTATAAATAANKAQTGADLATTTANTALAKLASTRVELGEGAAATGTRGTAIGTRSAASGRLNAIALGTDAKASGDASSVAIGTESHADHQYAVAIGHRARVTGNTSTAIGYEALASGAGVTAIGRSATGSADYTVALGHNAKASGASAIALGHGSVATVANTVSVGSASQQRKIVNVADGVLSAASTEAVTGKQLHATDGRVAAADNKATAAQTTATTASTTANNAVAKLTSAQTALGKDAVATGTNATGVGIHAKASGANATALGTGAEGAGSSAVALGAGTKAMTSGAVALGQAASASQANAMAMGAQASSTNSYATAVGYQAAASGSSAVAIGSVSSAAAQHSLAFGDRASVAATSAAGMALGRGAKVDENASKAVALGTESVATVANAISVGNATLKRKIVNVGDGLVAAGSSEAVTGNQLSATNTNVTAATNTANTAKADAATALTQVGAVGGLIRQTAANANVRIGAENTGTIIDVRNKNEAGRKLSGVADGALSGTSTEAVTGKQLHTTNTNVTAADNKATAAQTTATAAATAASKAQTGADLANSLVSQASATGNVRLGAQNTGRTLDVRNQGGLTRTVSGVTDGALSATSTEAVTGKQLHATDGKVTAADNKAVAAQTTATAAATAASKAQTGADLANSLVSQVSGTGNVRLGAQNTGRTLDVRNQGDLTRTVSGVTDGALSATSTDAVTGKVFFAAKVQSLITEASSTGTVRVGIGNEGVRLDVRNKDNQSRTLTGVSDGALSATSTEAVTGKQLHATDGKVTAADNKAVAAQTTATAAATAANKAQTGADLANSLVSQVSGTGNVRLGAQNTGRTLDVRNQGNLTRTLSGVTDGALSATSTDAVTGGQLFATNEVVKNQKEVVAGNTRLIGDNRSSIATLRTDLDAATANLDYAVMFNKERTVVDLGNARISGLAAGDISRADSREAVNGGQLFATNARVGYLEDQQRYVAVGSDEYSEAARAGWGGVAIGTGTEAAVDGEGATALGSFAKAAGDNSVALGRAAHVHAGSAGGFALGTLSQVAVQNGVALGTASEVRVGAQSSVALGYASIATESNSLSIGNSNLKRRIVNLGAGIADDNATTVAQLNGALDGLGGGASVDATGAITAPEYVLSGGTYDNVGTALLALDSAVVTTKSDVDALGSQVNRLFQEEASTRTDGPGRLNLGGAHGMVLGNVANGLIASGSRDAVNGGQLYEVQKNLQGQIDTLEGRGSEPVAMMARMGTPVETPVDTPVAKVDAPEPVVKAEGDNAVAVGSEGKERSVRHVAKGTADTDAVNVRQLNDVLTQSNEYTDLAVEGLNKRLDGMDKRFNRMAAMSSAQSAMAMNTAGLNTYNRLGAGVGHSDGESALAVGYQRVMNERGSATFSLNGAFTNSGEKTVGVGVGIGW